MLIDTNVIVRFLVERPDTIEAKFAGVFPFFAKVERGEVRVHLLELVLFQVFFVLTSYYAVPTSEAAEKLKELIAFRGIHMNDKATIRTCLETLETRNIDLVDGYLAAYARHKNIEGVYSFNRDLEKLDLKLLDVE